MNFSFSSLFAGLVFGVIGVALIKSGKKAAHPLHIGIGFTLCIYPYFVDSNWLLWGIGAGLCAVAWVKK